MIVNSYRDLLVWQKAMDLAVECYRITKHLPRDEIYGLISQAQRAAVSVPANIAEGHGRQHLGDYLRHLSVAKGSLLELETHLLLINRLSYLPTHELGKAFGLCEEIGKMLTGLSKSLKKCRT